jgi:hypothetical protein
MKDLLMENNLTILDCVVKLLDFFSKKTIFDLNKDYRTILGITGNDLKQDKALIQLALDELDQSGAVKKTLIGKDFFYFLRKPLDSIDQNITISHSLAKNIAEKINFYCKFFKNERDYCNPFSLKDKDILNLLNIISYFENKEPKPEND